MWTDALADWVRAECGATSVDIVSTGLGPAMIIPDAAEVLSFEGDPCHPRPVLRIRLADRAFTLRPELSIRVSAPMAVAPAAVGSVVEWASGEATLGTFAGDIVSPGDWVASVPVRAGEVLTTLRVEAVPDAHAGATLSLAVRSGALEIRSDGRLLRDARIGDEVRVFVPATGRVVVGTLVSADRVELRTSGG